MSTAKKKGIGNPFATFGSSNDTSTPVEQQASIPASQLDSTPVEQQASKPVVKKYTYYLPLEKNMKLEQIRLARLARGIVVDKSALVGEAIDLLLE